MTLWPHLNPRELAKNDDRDGGEMCGRVIQASPPGVLRWRILDRLGDRGRDSRMKEEPYANVPRRYDGALWQELWVIRRHPETGEHP